MMKTFPLIAILAIPACGTRDGIGVLGAHTAAPFPATTTHPEIIPVWRQSVVASQPPAEPASDKTRELYGSWLRVTGP